MSSSYNQLQTKFNTLLALQLDTQGGTGGSQNLQQVLTKGRVSDKDITLTDANTYTTFLNQDGLSVSNSTGSSFFRSMNIEFASGMGLFTDSVYQSMQLLNPIGSIDISGIAVSIMGVEYKPTCSGTQTISPFYSSGRISFNGFIFSDIPSVCISQVSSDFIVALAITEITLVDFGWKSTDTKVGSICWTAK
jgi:hypothetical protein